MVSELGNEGVLKLEEWLSQKLPSDAKIGFDPQLTSEGVYKKYNEVGNCACSFIGVFCNMS